MKLLTKDIRERLLKNGRINHEFLIAQDDDRPRPDFLPVVKLFTPDAGCTWLLSELDPDEPDRAFGLCDLGMGFPELGYVSMIELAQVRGQIGLPVERDMYFTPKQTISEYAAEARELSRINA